MFDKLSAAQFEYFLYISCATWISKVKEKPSAGQFGAVQRPECLYVCGAYIGPVHGAET